MLSEEKYKVAIIGTGNLSFHMSPLIDTIHFLELKYFVSRNFENSQRFADKFNCTPLRSVAEIPRDIDIVFIWTSDDQISSLSVQMAQSLGQETILAHSSGTKSPKIIDDYFENRGVMWPIQSFSQNDNNLDLRHVPICIQGSNSHSVLTMRKISDEISEKVIEVSNQQKGQLHLASVISNNFTNHLFHISRILLEDKDLDFKLLLPLINKTVEKIQIMDPKEAQTGPAIRKDKRTMARHRRILKSYPNMRSIYLYVSKSIRKLKQR